MTASTHLQVNENQTFQTWFWGAQRIAWVLLGGLIAAALLGLTGVSGPYAQRVVENAFFSVDYPAITRRQTESVLDFTVTSDQPATTLHFDKTFQRTFTIMSMTPPPTDAFATDTGVAYRFALAGQGAKTLRIVVMTNRSGVVDYTVLVDGRTALLSSVILP